MSESSGLTWSPGGDELTMASRARRRPSIRLHARAPYAAAMVAISRPMATKGSPVRMPIPMARTTPTRQAMNALRRVWTRWRAATASRATATRLTPKDGHTARKCGLTTVCST